jgi:hypothetical protein
MPPIPPALITGAVIKSMDAVVGAVDKLTGAVRDAYAKSVGVGDKFEKASLELGMSFAESGGKLAGSVEGLRGDLTTKFLGAFLTMEAGMEGNTKGVNKLINQQMLTGTQYAETARIFAQLEAIGGLQRDVTNKLSGDILTLNQTYRVSTEVLVKALESLADSFPAARLAGMGEQLAGAMATLTAEFGPQFSKSLTSVMNMIMDTSIEGFTKLTMLGIGRVREQLAAAKSTAEATEILKKAFVTASDSFKTISGGVNATMLSIGVASDTFSKQAIRFTDLADKMSGGLREQHDASVDFARTISTLKKEVLTPIFEALMTKLYPFVLAFTEVFSRLGKALATGMGKWLTDVLPKTEKAFNKIVEVLLDGVVVALNSAQAMWAFVSFQIKNTITVFKALRAMMAPQIFILKKVTSLFMALMETLTGVIRSFTILPSILPGGVTPQEALAAVGEDFKRAAAHLVEYGGIGGGSDVLWGNKFVDPIKNAFVEGSSRFIDDTASLLQEKGSSRFLDDTASILQDTSRELYGISGETKLEEQTEEARQMNEHLRNIERLLQPFSIVGTSPLRGAPVTAR